MIILSRVLCNTSSGETLTVHQGNPNGTIYVIKNVANILPYCVINKNQMSAAEMKVLTQVRSALAQLSTAQQQNVLAKLGGGQPGKNLHTNVFIFVSFKVLGPQIPPAPAHVSNGMGSTSMSNPTGGLQFFHFISSSLYL